ncbi:zinc finger, CCHC-type containing protein [Tanacetum coccineum]
MDVKTTFLNGDLDEEVYMKQPEGFVMPGNEHKVCKLVKSLYGLKQAPKQWHQKFDEVVLSSGKPVDQLEYSRAIGCLMYAMTSTRPDIAYVVGRLSRFTSNPSRQHWKAITRVFKYLRGTMNYGLSYMGYPSVLEGYSDASWINHVEDSSSTSGWVFLLGEVHFMGFAESNTHHCSTILKLNTQFPSNTSLEAEFNVESSQLEIGTRVFIFSRCKTKRITYVNMKFSRFKKLGLGFLYSNGLTGRTGDEGSRMKDPTCGRPLRQRKESRESRVVDDSVISGNMFLKFGGSRCAYAHGYYLAITWWLTRCTFHLDIPFIRASLPSMHPFHPDIPFIQASLSSGRAFHPGVPFIRTSLSSRRPFHLGVPFIQASLPSRHFVHTFHPTPESGLHSGPLVGAPFRRIGSLRPYTSTCPPV